MYRILLVEDDFSLAVAMAKQLESYGNEVVRIHDFRSVTSEFIACQPQLVLMDIMLPFRDGYSWCREIRSISPVPVVFISSASENMNIVMAISMGGDDFIIKPVDPMVLCAKVQAILRRSYELPSAASPCLEFCGALLRPDDNTVLYEGRETALTRNEYRILRTLIEHRGRIVSRDALMNALWQSDCYVEENTLTQNVTRLRKKLEEAGIRDAIRTKTGSGYMMP